ncbi:MAG: hypothetical protein ABL933_04350 [Methyloglobulus sp.]|nr:hypothetical protein [Methyloglobulus sp.]
MPDKRTEIVKLQGVVKTIPSHQQLMQINRRLRAILCLLLLVVFVLGIIYAPNQDVVAKLQKASPSDAVSEGLNPAVSAEVNTLKGQLIGLVSGSIESKLKTLEISVKSGSVNNSLGTIADLKKDILTLREYSDVPKKQEVVVSNQQLSEEVSHLKHLIYTTLASCGLMFAAAAGVWVKYRKRLPYIKKDYLSKR